MVTRVNDGKNTLKINEDGSINISSGSGGGGGGSTESGQIITNQKLDDIYTELQSVSTEAKQDVQITKLDDIYIKLSSNPSTETKQDNSITKLSDINNSIGGTSDVLATNDSGSWSSISLLKRISSFLSSIYTSTLSLILSQGNTTDVSATTDTGNFSIISLIKRSLVNWTTLHSKVPTLSTTSGRLNVDNSGVTQPISAVSLPLPLDASTSANQTITNSSLSSIDTKTPSLGQNTMINSTPVVIASDHTPIVISDIRDTSKVSIQLYTTNVIAPATNVETLITLTKSSGINATTTGTSFTISNGKRFRITSLNLAIRGSATATVTSNIFSLRVNPLGAVTTTTTPIIFRVRLATPTTANIVDRMSIPFPEGLDIVGTSTLQIGLSIISTYVNNAPTYDVLISGYEF